MAFVNCGVVPRNGKSPTFFRDYDYNLNLVFPTDRTYMIGIDQSSKNTGIYMTDTDVSFHFICDFTRTESDNYRFYEQLRLFVKRIVKGAKVGLFVTENLPPMKYRNSGNVLRELKGVLKTWRVHESMPEISEMPDDRFTTIYPQTWKSKIVDKSKGKNRHLDKRLVAEDICDKFPELREYLHRVPNNEYDSYDATGILHGYLLANHTTDGYQQIAGSKDYTGDIMVFYRLVPKDQLGNPEVTMANFEVQQINEKSKTMALNKDVSMFNNFKMAASKHSFVMTIIDDLLQSMSVRWQFDLGMNNDALVCYILRKSTMSKKQIDFLRSTMPYEEIL
jgi:hypothetical protein